MGENLTADSVTFQSTLPARGATEIAYIDLSKGDISIHAPRTGSDTQKSAKCDSYANFNPRSPHGERLNVGAHRTQAVSISIHAPRTGSDADVLAAFSAHCYFNPRSPHGERRAHPAGRADRRYFNPRSPHGERHAIPSVTGEEGIFQSTLPARGATVHHLHRVKRIVISIHAPRTGSDSACNGSSQGDHAFQSTLPARGATSTGICRALP